MIIWLSQIECVKNVYSVTLGCDMIHWSMLWSSQSAIEDAGMSLLESNFRLSIQDLRQIGSEMVDPVWVQGVFSALTTLLRYKGSK